MCPSIQCPSCRKKSYHKGSCENEECGYNPTGASFSEDFEIALKYLLEKRSDKAIQTVVNPTPFPRFRILAPKLLDLLAIAKELGYEGPAPYVVDSDLYEPDRYAIELVRDAAKPWVSAL